MTPYFTSADGGVVLYLGDCQEVFPQLAAVDHVITDPPYADVTHIGARSLRGGSIHAPIAFESFASAQLLDHFAAVVPRRWLIATLEWRHMLALEQTPPVGLRFVRFGLWVKTNGAPQFSGDRPATGWEAVAILHRCGERMHWNGGGTAAVFRHPVARNTVHPTEKPLSLMRELVALFTDPGETILDPFAGSGTTLIAAAEQGRRAIGIEISEQFAEGAAKRLAGMTSPLKLDFGPRETQGPLSFEVTA